MLGKRAWRVQRGIKCCVKGTDNSSGGKEVNAADVSETCTGGVLKTEEQVFWSVIDAVRVVSVVEDETVDVTTDGWMVTGMRLGLGETAGNWECELYEQALVAGIVTCKLLLTWRFTGRETVNGEKEDKSTEEKVVWVEVEGWIASKARIGGEVTRDCFGSWTVNSGSISVST